MITKGPHSARASRAGSARRADRASRARVAEMQRSRLLAAATRVVDELGYEHATVANITGCARVSRLTFYDLFSNREDCLVCGSGGRGAAGSCGEFERRVWRSCCGVSVCAGGCGRSCRSWIASRCSRGCAWCRRCVGSQGVLERREEILARLAAVSTRVVVRAPVVPGCPPLTAEGLVGAAFAIVYARLLRGDSEPLTGLHRELMGYDRAALPRTARRRVASRRVPRPRPVTRHAVNGVPADAQDGSARIMILSGGRSDAFDVSDRAGAGSDRVREARGASNRLAGDLAGVSDQGQISKLLGRLGRLGLIENTGEGHSGVSATRGGLTPLGRQVAHEAWRHQLPAKHRRATHNRERLHESQAIDQGDKVKPTAHTAKSAGSEDRSLRDARWPAPCSRDWCARARPDRRAVTSSWPSVRSPASSRSHCRRRPSRTPQARLLRLVQRAAVRRGWRRCGRLWRPVRVGSPWRKGLPPRRWSSSILRASCSRRRPRLGLRTTRVLR